MHEILPYGKNDEAIRNEGTNYPESFQHILTQIKHMYLS